MLGSILESLINQSTSAFLTPRVYMFVSSSSASLILSKAFDCLGLLVCVVDVFEAVFAFAASGVLPSITVCLVSIVIVEVALPAVMIVVVSDVAVVESVAMWVRS